MIAADGCRWLLSYVVVVEAQQLVDSSLPQIGHVSECDFPTLTKQKQIKPLRVRTSFLRVRRLQKTVSVIPSPVYPKKRNNHPHMLPVTASKAK